MGSGMSASNNFRKLVLTDVEKDVKRWKEAIDYVENRKSCDQRTMRILRQMMIETILLMHDIQKTKVFTKAGCYKQHTCIYLSAKVNRYQAGNIIRFPPSR